MGDAKTWDQWNRTIRRQTRWSRWTPRSGPSCYRKGNEAQRDSRLAARFKSYRLNIPSADESTMLLSVADFESMCKRSTPARVGRPVVAVDMGSGRSWSAAVCVFRSLRVEALAVCPGIPSVEAQETRDLQPAGTYQRLVDSGVLTPAPGVRVPAASLLVEAIKEKWGCPELITCDRFRLADLEDAKPGCRIVPRVTRWSEAASDVRALRCGAADGGLSVAEDSQDLIAASLSVAQVKNDDAGNFRLSKRSRNNQSRDDVAAALVLAAGAAASTFKRPPARPIRFFVAS